MLISNQTSGATVAVGVLSMQNGGKTGNSTSQGGAVSVFLG